MQNGNLSFDSPAESFPARNSRADYPTGACSGMRDFAGAALVFASPVRNGHGMARGGVIFTLADSAFAYACNSRNEAAVAQQAAIAFLSPGRAGETLIAAALEQASEGRAGVYTVTVTATNSRTVAIFQGLSPPSAGRCCPRPFDSRIKDGLEYRRSPRRRQSPPAAGLYDRRSNIVRS